MQIADMCMTGSDYSQIPSPVYPTSSSQPIEGASTFPLEHPAHTSDAQGVGLCPKKRKSGETSTASAKRRKRTRIEHTNLFTPNSPSHPAVQGTNPNWQPPRVEELSMDNFLITPIEEKEMEKMLHCTMGYMMYKQQIVNESQGKLCGKSPQHFLRCLEDADTERSNVVYIDILDEYADSKETILHVLGILQKKLSIGHKMKWLAVVGDAKTFTHLEALKIEYGTDPDWLIPLPGDWHVLKNYQPVLMKAFFDAGLRDIAKATGYSEGALNSIGACTKFKRTHTFLLSVWEAMFRVLLSGFLECKKPDIISQAAMLLRHASDCSSDDDSCTPTLRLFARMLQGDSDVTQSFTDYLKTMAATDDTIKF